MRFLFAAAVCLCVAGAPAARASSGQGGEEKAAAESPAEGESERAPGTPGVPTVGMPILIAPVIVNGELDHYVYLTVSLKLNDGNQRTMVSEKIPYLQDAFLREVHGPSIARNNDPSIVDEAALLARLMRVCETVVGAGVVKTIEIKNAAQATN